MTNSNPSGDGEGLPPLPSRGRLPESPWGPSAHRVPPLPSVSDLVVSGPGDVGAVPGVPAPTRPPEVPVSPIVEASVSGLELPAIFSMAHLLDHSFVAKIANELFAEGEPFASTNHPETLGHKATDNVPAPGVAELQARRFERMDFHDPALFQSVADEVGPVPTLPLDGKNTAPAGMDEGFYFLAPVPEPVSPADPRPLAQPSALATPSDEWLAELRPFGSINDPTTLGRRNVDNAPSAGIGSPQGIPFDAAAGMEPPLAPVMPGEAILPGGLPGDASVPNAPEVDDFYFLQVPDVSVVPATPVRTAAPSSRQFHVEAVRRDFPILDQRIHGKPLVWLDNAATTQKPLRVIEAISSFYKHDNSNIHRAAHTLAARATTLYEEAREKVRRFLGAGQVEEIVFVHGATEAINLVAQTYGRQFLQPGDEIIVSTIEHHANIVPWQHVSKEKGANLRVVPVNDRGEVLLEAYEKLLGPRTKIVAITQVSNALGTILPVRTMIQLAHRHGAKVLVDGAQSAPHMAVDVQALDADFFVLAGHKIFGPTGIGVLYGKRELLEVMPPWQGGGNMIDQVTFEETTYQQPPAKFEAGTGILAGAVGLGAAIDYLDELGMENISRYEHDLLTYAMDEMRRVPGLHLIGTADEKASVLSFIMDGLRNEDVGRYLDQEGIAVRAGHHCAQPTMRRFGLESTVRPSLAFYNTHAEIDTLVSALRRLRSDLA